MLKGQQHSAGTSDTHQRGIQGGLQRLGSRDLASPKVCRPGRVIAQCQAREQPWYRYVTQACITYDA